MSDAERNTSSCQVDLSRLSDQQLLRLVDDSQQPLDTRYDAGMLLMLRDEGEPIEGADLSKEWTVPLTH